MNPTILDLAQANILFIIVATPTILYGIIKEKHYVAPLSIVLTVINLGISFVSTPIGSWSFIGSVPLFGLGLYVISRDVKKQYQKFWVAFLLGSKTIGSVTLFLGFMENNWVMLIFEPLAKYAITKPELLNNLTIYTHIIGILIVLGTVHGIGLIMTATSKK
jgi:hypothetical protein